MDTPQNTNFEQVMHERFAQLPPTVQAAITSAEVETHMRELAKSHQLHLDQWDLLENEVMLTLLGLQKMSDLKNSIIKEVGVSEQVATELANDISEHVFKPIRHELEHQLENSPVQSDAPTEPSTAAAAPFSTPAANKTPTATPAAPASDKKAVRPAAAATYLSQTSSHERKSIDGDPYREQLG